MSASASASPAPDSAVPKQEESLPKMAHRPFDDEGPAPQSPYDHPPTSGKASPAPPASAAASTPPPAAATPPPPPQAYSPYGGAPAYLYQFYPPPPPGHAPDGTPQPAPPPGTGGPAYHPHPHDPHGQYIPIPYPGVGQHPYGVPYPLPVPMHAHVHPHAHGGPPPQPGTPGTPGGLVDVGNHSYTDDAGTKLSDRVRRRCFNCCTTETSTWRRSNLNPGKVLCNKCGLFERTHNRARPEAFPHKRTPVGGGAASPSVRHQPYPSPGTPIASGSAPDSASAPPTPGVGVYAAPPPLPGRHSSSGGVVGVAYPPMQSLGPPPSGAGPDGAPPNGNGVDGAGAAPPVKKGRGRPKKVIAEGEEGVKKEKAPRKTPKKAPGMLAVEAAAAAGVAIPADGAGVGPGMGAPEVGMGLSEDFGDELEGDGDAGEDGDDAGDGDWNGRD